MSWEGRLIRVASGSKVKRGGVVMAAEQVRWRPSDYHIKMCPVDLPGTMSFNEQPEGRAETERYARIRNAAMRNQYGANPDAIDIAVESGAIDGLDVAVVILSHKGTTQVGASVGIPFPEGSLEEARRRGFKTTTAGHVIHEWFPEVPADNWHHMMADRLDDLELTREKQIAMALVPLLRGAI